MSKSIHQEVNFKVSPNKIYEVLLSGCFANPEGCGAGAGDATKNKTAIEAGAKFSLFGGKIEGRNIELVPNKRIVQAWRPANWESGIYSIVKFELSGDSKGTKLAFEQLGFPEDHKEHLETGWKKNYWEAIEKFLDTPSVGVKSSK